ncbi:uncharacterized protein VTP21DRAFT_2009 [Calcarisporiella thermophila]|uniref:uncharacterized protein n=1 Tax=Calcarisporiella thermophila TaxID=911321 RepID=UPI003742E2ED
MTDLVGSVRTLNKDKEAEAQSILKRIASQVKPIMKRRGWRIGALSEFYPKNPNLMGLNVNKGQEIKLRLRYSYDEKKFMEYDYILGTMLHELVHIVHGPHDQKFYALLDQLFEEYESLVDDGYTGEGFEGKGYRVGVGVSHNVPVSLIRETMAKAAEKRRRINELMPSGGRRLGGTRRENIPLRQLVAEAAERRKKDRIWCGNADSNDEEDEKGEKSKASDVGSEPIISRGNSSTAPYTKTLNNCDAPLRATSSELPPALGKRKLDQDEHLEWKKWVCSLCTLINRPLALQCEACFSERPASD